MKKENYYLLSFIILLLIFLLIRLKGISTWAFALDEYYLSKSVTNILAHGLPQFQFGGYYDRGILLQYLIAFIALTGIKFEFAARIISVITNLISIHPLYAISKKASNKIVAIVVVVIFGFSIWEIEFARFARMYSPFQMLFLYYVWFAIKFIYENENNLKWLFLISAISIFLYEGSIFLILSNFLLLFFKHYIDEGRELFKNNLKKIFLRIGISFGIFIAAYLFLTFDFRTLGMQDLLPPELNDYFVSKPVSSRFRMPIVFFLLNPNSFVYFLIPITSVIIFIWILIKVFSKNYLSRYSRYLLISALLLCLLNLYFISLLLVIISLLFNAQIYNDIKKVWISVLVSIAAFFILQTLYALNSSEWMLQFPYTTSKGTVELLKGLWKYFLNYPYIYEVFALFRDIMPVYTFGSISIISAGIFLIIIKAKEKLSIDRFIIVYFLILLFLTTLINTRETSSRYFFYIYPIFITILILSVKNIMEFFVKNNNYQKILTVLVGLLLFFVSSDFSINHIVNIDSPEINFRKNFSFKRNVHFYPRWDTKSVAEIINKNASPDDIIITDEQTCDFYLDRLDYLYRNYTSDDFAIESVESGKRERWTGANLVYKCDDLKKLLNKPEITKWFIVNTTWGWVENEEKKIFEQLNKHLIYESVDGTSFLYKIAKGKQF